jgi:flagellin
MRIQNNIMAINTHRQYGINNTNIAKSLEKLSSGYRVNRAGDDAAGLAISEKMRAQIRGLNMASKNSQDAISLVQTAEGALQSTHDILQRMRELAVQSASDTNEQVIDRGALQQEFKALQAEVNEIAAKTRFNDQNLIDGTFSKYQVAIGGSASGIPLGSGLATRVSATGLKYGTMTFTTAVNAATATSTTGGTPAGITFTPGSGTNSAIDSLAITGPSTSAFNNNNYTLQIDDQGGDNLIFRIMDSNSQTVATSASIDISAWDKTASSTNIVTVGGFGTLTFTNATTAPTTAQQIADLLSLQYNGGAVAVDNVGADPVVTPAKAASIDITLNGETMNVKLGDTSATFRNSGVTIYFDGGIRDFDMTAGGMGGTLNGTNVIVDALLGNALTIQVGANQGDEISINLDKMNTVALGIDGSSIANRLDASRSITEVNDALNKVSTQRAALGALQNRLEFKISNLDISAENLQAAESRIRDLDMAKEMTKFTTANILAQAATAMLAQANAVPQGVLQLLK